MALRPTHGLDRRDQRRDARLFATAVGNEDVGHVCRTFGGSVAALPAIVIGEQHFELAPVDA